MKLLNQQECREEIAARLSKVTPETLRRWGRMNASQMICHLSDALLGIMGDKPMAPIRGLNLWPMMKWFVLYAPMKWPQGVATRPEFDQHIGGTRPAEFAQDMERLMRCIERFTAEPRDFEFRPHPMFKQLRRQDWMRWGYLHCDHHLRQFGA
jgi:hypothetical protein